MILQNFNFRSSTIIMLFYYHCKLDDPENSDKSQSQITKTGKISTFKKKMAGHHLLKN